MTLLKRLTLFIPLLALFCSPLFANQLGDRVNPFRTPPINMASMHDMSFNLFFVMLAGFGLWSIYKKRLSLGLLILLGAMSASWQEFYADWGSYLYWNPEFPQLPWGETPFTTPDKPMFIPFSWGWYFALIYTLLATLITWLHGKLPAIPRWLLISVIAGPLFFAYNIYGEHQAANMAWWGYAHSFGPYAEGTYASYPYVWPTVSLVLWSIVLLCMFTAKDDSGHWWHERKLGVHRIEAGLVHGLARIGSFMVAINVSCLLVVTIPCIAVRLIWGVDSPIVP